MLWELLDLCGCEPWMLSGIIAKIPAPQDRPTEARNSEDDERATPRHQQNQPRHQRRSHGTSEPGGRMRDTLCEGSFALRHPYRHSAGCDRQSRNTEAEHQPPQPHLTHVRGETDKHSRCRPDDGGNREREARAHPITYPTTGDLESQIRITKCRENFSYLRVVE